MQSTHHLSTCPALTPLTKHHNRRKPARQAESYRALANPDALNIALADQAGSGKTLAYLLPLLQEIRSEEAAAGRPGTVPGSPRILIVTPTGGGDDMLPVSSFGGGRAVYNCHPSQKSKPMSVFNLLKQPTPPPTPTSTQPQTTPTNTPHSLQSWPSRSSASSRRSSLLD